MKRSETTREKRTAVNNSDQYKAITTEPRKCSSLQLLQSGRCQMLTDWVKNWHESLSRISCCKVVSVKRRQIGWKTDRSLCLESAAAKWSVSNAGRLGEKLTWGFVRVLESLKKKKKWHYTSTPAQLSSPPWLQQCCLTVTGSLHVSMRMCVCVCACACVRVCAHNMGLACLASCDLNCL